MRSVLTLVITLMSNSLTSTPTGGTRVCEKSSPQVVGSVNSLCGSAFVMRHPCRPERTPARIRMRFLVYQLYMSLVVCIRASSRACSRHEAERIFTLLLRTIKISVLNITQSLEGREREGDAAETTLLKQ